MQKKTESKQLLRLSRIQLQGSRAGVLGRFPAQDLYEPEEANSHAESAIRSQGTHAKEKERANPHD
jgi:hypothetical protein